MSFLEVNLTEEEKDAIRRQDGYNEGSAEEKKKISLKMKEEGFEYGDIERITGLPIEEIESL